MTNLDLAKAWDNMELHRAKPRYIRKRKNLSNIYEVLKFGLENGNIKEGTILDTRELVNGVLRDFVDKWFDRASLRGDDAGPTRSVGDLLGKHGLNLRKVRNRQYVMPFELPVVEDDKVLKEAVYR